jgi:hypothetical protein
MVASFLVFFTGYREKVLVDRQIYRRLISLEREIDEEVAKGLDLTAVVDSYGKFSRYESARDLTTLEDVEAYLNGPDLNKMQKYAEETRPALLLIAYLNSTKQLKTKAKDIGPSWTFALVQALDRTVVDALYTPRISNFITRYNSMGSLQAAKANLDSASMELQKESAARKISKIVSGTIVVALIPIAFSFSPTNLLLVQLLVFSYTFSNGVLLVVRWLASGSEREN